MKIAVTRPAGNARAQQRNALFHAGVGGGETWNLFFPSDARPPSEHSMCTYARKKEKREKKLGIPGIERAQTRARAGRKGLHVRIRGRSTWIRTSPLRVRAAESGHCACARWALSRLFLKLARVMRSRTAVVVVFSSIRTRTNARWSGQSHPLHFFTPPIGKLSEVIEMRYTKKTSSCMFALRFAFFYLAGKNEEDVKLRPSPRPGIRPGQGEEGEG